jgi:superfamily I DNA/RNA helicase
MIEKFESMLNWEKSPEQVPGKFAFCAPANQDFWQVWRADKLSVKALGISCKPSAGRDWLVTWIRDNDFSVPALPVEAFVAAPLPEHIKFSPEQLAILEHARSGEGNFIVRARAGSGKTFITVLAFGQASEAVQVYGIFGKRNQKEAEEKIKDKRVTIKTLHSIGFMFIKQNWRNAQPNDRVEWDRVEAVVGANAPDDVRNAVHRLVGFGKNIFVSVPSVDELVEVCEERQIDADAYEGASMGGWVLSKLAACAQRVMELSMKKDSMNRISFNDMVWLPVAMNWVRPVFQFGIIDEAQDMNAPQLEMARRCVSGRLGVVGDDRQCIFGFRGAMLNSIDYMKEVLNAKEFGLTITRRCPKAVVELVKPYVPDYQAADDAPEGIVRDASHAELMLAVPGDAILSRANAPLMPICLRLLRKGISARIEGRDIGAMLLKLVEKMKANSVPNYIARVQAHWDRALARLKNVKDSESKIEAANDLHETLLAIAQDAKSVQDIKDRCENLFQDSDKSPRPAVVLSSVHKAKGLEWNKVFAIRSTLLRPGCESREEENIYYVACTRTKNELVFVSDPPKED